MAPFLSSPSLEFPARIRSVLTSVSLSPVAALLKRFTSMYSSLYGNFDPQRAVSVPRGSTAATRVAGTIANALDDLGSFRLVFRLFFLELLWTGATTTSSTTSTPSSSSSPAPSSSSKQKSGGLEPSLSSSLLASEGFELPEGWEVATLDVVDAVLFERVLPVLSRVVSAKAARENAELTSKFVGLASASMADLGVKEALRFPPRSVGLRETDGIAVAASYSSMGAPSSLYEYDEETTCDMVTEEEGLDGETMMVGFDVTDDDVVGIHDDAVGFSDVDGSDGGSGGGGSGGSAGGSGSVGEDDGGVVAPPLPTSLFAAFDAVDSADFDAVDFFEDENASKSVGRLAREDSTGSMASASFGGSSLQDSPLLSPRLTPRSVAFQEVDAYAEAIEWMVAVGQEPSPRAKLNALVRVSEALVTAVRNAGGEGVALGAEDTFPLVLYALLKSQMEAAGSVVSLLRIFISEPFEGEEGCYRVAAFESALAYLGSLDPRVRDGSGVFIPVSALKQNLSYAMYAGFSLLPRDSGLRTRVNGLVPGVAWFLQLLCRIGYSPSLSYGYDEIVVVEDEWETEIETYRPMADALTHAAGLRLEERDGVGFVVCFVQRYPLSVYAELVDELRYECWKDDE